MSTEAYPLHWPPGWPRTEANRRTKTSKFEVTVGKAIDELYTELDRLGAKDIVLSSNLTLSSMHRPLAKQSNPLDPGIAVYFSLKGKRMVMARDAFGDWRDNIRSLGLAVEAFRALHRHGGADMMERAFTGFAALENKSEERWHHILGVASDADKVEVGVAYRRLRSLHHPDKNGDPAMFDRIQKAYKEFELGQP